MPDYGLAFVGKYLAAVELGTNEPTVTIVRVEMEMLEGGEDEDGGGEKKPPRKRWVLYFAGKEKGLVVNKTNALLLVALTKSRMTEQWVGHAITIASREVRFGKVMKPGIRIIGSPELSAPLAVEIKLPKRKATTWTLTPTKTKAPPQREAGQEG